MTNDPSIPEWLMDRGVLITGATGFIGKVLLAKLLISCPKGGNIYLLVREKRGASPNARLRSFLQDEPFRELRENYPERLKRLIVISGDTTLVDLGLSTADKHCLVENVSVIFHMAANVRFDLPIRAAVTINTIGTLNLIAVAKQLPKLKSLVYVSTAYCHCGEDLLEEKAYPPLIPPETIISMIDHMSDEFLQSIEPKLLGDQPNTYALSKCLSEDLIFRSGLPVGIARPSIVIAAWKEPTPGWIENLHGPTGLVVGGGKGVIRSLHCNGHYLADIIPCDIVANATIALAWKVGLQDSRTPIFVNVTEGGRNPITWEYAIYTGEKIVLQNPFSGVLWYPGGRITSSIILHWIAMVFLHLLPAYLIDCLMILSGNKPFMIKIQSRVSSGLKMLQYYTTKKWNFKNDGLVDLENRLCPEDRKAFFMDTKTICWDDYLRDYVLGIRKYCLKDDLSTLPRAKQVLKRLYIADIILRTLFATLILWLIYSFITSFRFIITSEIKT